MQLRKRPLRVDGGGVSSFCGTGPGAGSMDAAIGELKRALQQVLKLERAIGRSEETHGVHAHSNRRDDKYRRHRRAFNRAVTAYEKAVEAATRGLVQVYDKTHDYPTATPKQFRRAASDVGSAARAVAPHRLSYQLKEAGIEPAGLRNALGSVLMDVEIAWRSRSL